MLLGPNRTSTRNKQRNSQLITVSLCIRKLLLVLTQPGTGPSYDRASIRYWDVLEYGKYRILGIITRVEQVSGTGHYQDRTSIRYWALLGQDKYQVLHILGQAEYQVLGITRVYIKYQVLGITRIGRVSGTGPYWDRTSIRYWALLGYMKYQVLDITRVYIKYQVLGITRIGRVSGTGHYWDRMSIRYWALLGRGKYQISDIGPCLSVGHQLCKVTKGSHCRKLIPIIIWVKCYQDVKPSKQAIGTWCVSTNTQCDNDLIMNVSFREHFVCATCYERLVTACLCLSVSG